MELGRRQPLFADAGNDRIEQCRCLSGPTCKGGSVDIDTLRGHHLGLAIERQVMIELGDDDMRQRCERCLAASYGLHRCRRLDDGLAGAAAILGADMANDPPTDGHDVEHLVGIGAERPQGTTAGGACTCAGHGFMDNLEARKVRGQCPDRRRAIGGGFAALATPSDGSGGGLELLERQLELGDLAGQLLGRLAERHPLQSGDLDAKHIDEQVARRNIGAGTGQGGIALGQKRFQCGNPLVPIGG